MKFFKKINLCYASKKITKKGIFKMPKKKISFRMEKDSMGEIQVPSNAYYGAQTARSLYHFSAGRDKMPIEVIKALGILKKASAIANFKLKKLSKEKKDLIVKASDEVIKGLLDEHFPLKVWQTGSGTQTNMNINEVIANRAIELAGGKLGSKKPIHPNDDVNMSQSSNDTFPTAMHIATAIIVVNKLLPSLKNLKNALQSKVKSFDKIVKIGRTHLQDAVPLTLGQEFSGYVSLIDRDIVRCEKALDDVYDLVIGGTAVGTGINTHPDFDKIVIKEISRLTQLPFKVHPNKFAGISAHDEIAAMSSTFRTAACSLYKIANDIRWLSSGPRCGLYEIFIPENEPGSSIMPGKVNPTQCEAMTMMSIQVMGNDAAIGFAASQGQFELNAYNPLMIHNLIHSALIMSESCELFVKHCVKGIKANKQKIAQYVENSLMLVTILSPVIGYDKASDIAHKAHVENLTLKQACLKLKYLSEEEFDKIVIAEKMTKPK